MKDSGTLLKHFKKWVSSNKDRHLEENLEIDKAEKWEKERKARENMKSCFRQDASIAVFDTMHQVILD